MVIIYMFEQVLFLAIRESLNDTIESVSLCNRFKSFYTIPVDTSCPYDNLGLAEQL